jgi:Ca2+-transporting ATPase
MFYKLAPRRRTTFREVWVGALAVTVLLQLLQALIVLYARNVAHFNAVYGAFGSVIVVLMWVYLSGSVIILGGCFCAAQAEVAGGLQYDIPPKPADAKA